jgi:DNA-binding MarR family transcriptional regulator
MEPIEPALDDDAMSLARDVGEAIIRVAYELDRRLESAAALDDVTPLEIRLLRLALDPRPQRELARLLGCDAARVSTLTLTLEDRGLVRRARTSGDQRIRRTEVTDLGREALARVGARLQDLSPIPTALTPSQMRQVIRLLAAIEAVAHEEPTRQGTR